MVYWWRRQSMSGGRESYGMPRREQGGGDVADAKPLLARHPWAVKNAQPSRETKAKFNGGVAFPSCQLGSPGKSGETVTLGCFGCSGDCVNETHRDPSPGYDF